MVVKKGVLITFFTTTLPYPPTQGKKVYIYIRFFPYLGKKHKLRYFPCYFPYSTLQLTLDNTIHILIVAHRHIFIVAHRFIVVY